MKSFTAENVLASVHWVESFGHSLPPWPTQDSPSLMSSMPFMLESQIAVSSFQELALCVFHYAGRTEKIPFSALAGGLRRTESLGIELR